MEYMESRMQDQIEGAQSENAQLLARIAELEADHQQAILAAVVRALEAAANACRARIGTGDPGISTQDIDQEAEACANDIRAIDAATILQADTNEGERNESNAV